MRRFVVVSMAALTACSGPAGRAGDFAVPPAATASSSRPLAAAGLIKHVVVIVQENRTFDNMFAGFPGADAPMFGYNSSGGRVNLHSVPFESLVNLDHDFQPAITAWNHGKMNGFDRNNVESGLARDYNYAYVDRRQSAPYWAMARRYTLADRMFPTEFGESFTGHLSLIAGTTSLSRDTAEVNNPIGSPWGCDASGGTYTFVVNRRREISNGPFPCFTQFATMANPLDDAHVSWKYYAPATYADKGGILWSEFDAIKAVRYGADWNNVVSPQTQVLSDAAAGKLPAVSWVIPDWNWSDHPSTGSDRGPSWVAAVVNAIGQGPDWPSTAIVLVWDDWGGWYDNVPPPQKDFRGLGIRVGCVIISPYAKRHYVSHTQYEFGSILRFEEEMFGLHAIGPRENGYTDLRAASLVDSFDFTQRPARFMPFRAKYPASYFLNYAPSMRPPDTDL